MEKTTGGKCRGAKRGMPRHSNNPGHIRQLQGTSLHLATFDSPREATISVKMLL